MLHKIKMLFSKGFGFLFVFLLFKLKTKKIVDNKRILIIFGGHIGNAILNIDLLLEIQKKYSKEYELYILCNDSIKNILETLDDFSDFKFLDISYPYKDGGTTFFNVIKTIKYMRSFEFDKIVVNLAHMMPLAEYIVAAIHSNDSIGVFDDINHKTKSAIDIEHNFGNARWYFEKAFKTPIYVDFNTQEMYRQKLILKHLDIEYNTRIYPIKKLTNMQFDINNYFTVTIDSAVPTKRWEIQKFARVINAICEEHEYKVAITGAKGAENDYNQLIKLIKNKERVYNFVGKTTFSQWVELLRNGLFHIGVDSGSVHVAASVGTQAFCLDGAWDGTRAYPYYVEIHEDVTISPICIYMDNALSMPCCGCIPKRGIMGTGNEECLLLCRNKEICFCLKGISAERVISDVKEWLHLEK